MTYIPIVPHVPVDESSPRDRRDFRTALKLLAGEGCIQDAQQAQALLLSLTESDDNAVAEAASAIMQTGLQKKWFEGTVPTYSILRDLAGHFLENSKPTNKQQRFIIMLALGFSAFILGVVMFFFASGASLSPQVPVIVIAATILLVLVVFFKARNM